MELVLFYFSIFFIYSFIGWIIEMIVENFILEHEFANRGFLIGPYCPVYGVASILMMLLLSRYSNDILVLFFMSVIICTVVEYFTSWLLETIFKARWWDYHDFPFNINGRICLINSIGFGILGVLLIKILNPSVVWLFSKINPIIFNIISFLLLLLFIFDIIFSFNIIKKIKVSASSLKKDNTNTFSNKVKTELGSKSIFIKRILTAFPDLAYNLIKKSKNRS